MLLIFHNYLIDITAINKNISSDDIGFKTIKTIINELLRLVGENIWSYYQAVLKHPTRDQYMYKYYFINIFLQLDNDLLESRNCLIWYNVIPRIEIGTEV